MAQRVAIIAGKKPGRDHFPWPAVAQVASYGPGYSYPFGLNAAKMLRWYAIVRQWRVTVGAVLTYVDREHYNEFGELQWDSNPGSLSVAFDLYSTTLVENVPSEAYFYTQPYFSYIPAEVIPTSFYQVSTVINHLGTYTNTGFGDRVGNLNVSIDVGTFGASVSLFIRLNRTNAGYTTDGQLFWPRAEFSLSGRNPSLARCLSEYESGPDDPDIPGYSNLMGTFAVDGESTPMYGYSGRATPEDGGDLLIDSCDVSVAPVRFWPYAGKDGLPIYDTVTGAILPDRDPLKS